MRRQDGWHLQGPVKDYPEIDGTIKTPYESSFGFIGPENTEDPDRRDAPTS